MYKDYVLVNLQRFEKGQIGCRWRTEREVLEGKGERTCGAVGCSKGTKNVYEMNFGYLEAEAKKNALVRVSVCGECAFKLNFRRTLKRVE